VSSTTALAPATPVVPPPREIVDRPSRSDRLYRGGIRTVGLTILVILVLIAVFLAYRAWPALHQAGFSFFTNTGFMTTGAHPRFGIAAALAGTATIALIALVVATPIGVASALFLTFYAPRRLRRPLTSLVDLMAAVPSIVYGLWGFFQLRPHLEPTARWIATHLAFIPIFRTSSSSQLSSYGSSAFIAGVLVGIMITPIVTSVSREVISLTPLTEQEAALALGATRSRMIRKVVLPFSKNGIIGALLLALGRALGETIAVSIIISPIFHLSGHVLQNGSNSIAALIADRFGSGGPLGLSALLAAGLVLFLVTLSVSLVASLIVDRAERRGAA
jgi:phosphate transport system permease protein